MPRELTMPKLSDSMEEATILRWLKAPGETFVRGEPLVEIETDKATIVYEAETEGVIARVVVPEGGAARVGEPIATLDGDAAASAEETASSARADEAEAVASDGPRPRVVRMERVRATPVARRRAVELGISLFGLRGTGPGGRITSRDVVGAVDGATASAARDKGGVESVRLSPTQETIARRMTLSTTSVPIFTVTTEIDMSTIVALRRGASDLVSRPSVNDFVVRAVALTLRELPAFNSSYVDGRLERYSRVNVGIAVAVEGALLVPTLFDADLKSIAQIASESMSLVARARTRDLSLDELTQSTFTVSNLGMYGVHSFTAIVDPPQAAILAVGGISRRPVERPDGGFEFRDVLFATLSADHRVVYGADGASFLRHLKSLLENPLTLVI